MMFGRTIWSSVLVAAVGGTALGASRPQPPNPPAAEQVERGRRTFLRVGCYECHGREAQGASTGPRLGPRPIPFASFVRAIRTPRNEMPPYNPRILSDEEIADIYAFVSARPAAVERTAGLRRSLSPFVSAAARPARLDGRAAPPRRLTSIAAEATLPLQWYDQ